ncbi:CrcB family protein [Rhodococcus sp. X156]|uniref:fluoride efflux transporter FluC n=1 Tax=Rhodococcus sp. X156 TaxID=2499145 RepID=UPI000FD9F382|nr:CrcB family protein [Rhodococcus sp. X156]
MAGKHTDEDLHPPNRTRQKTLHVLVAIALGGALGALARHGLDRGWTTDPGGFPWSTLVENVLGSFLLGVIVVAVTEKRSGHPLLYPFLGTGLMGGFTTFSTYAVDAVTRDSSGVATIYAVVTLVGALAAAWLGVQLTRSIGAR